MSVLEPRHARRHGTRAPILMVILHAAHVEDFNLHEAGREVGLSKNWAIAPTVLRRVLVCTRHATVVYVENCVLVGAELCTVLATLLYSS